MTRKNAKDVVVLVVDDEDVLRRVIVRDFQRQGYQVLSASSGDEAFAIVERHAIDVVLSDVRMPRGDGTGLLKRIKALNPARPVFIFVTGRAEMMLEETFDWGAAAVFNKPFDRGALFKAVADAVTTSDERWSRRLPSVEADLVIALRFGDLSTAIAQRAIAVARGGMFLALTTPFPPVDSPVSFAITFDEGAPAALNGTGVVRWVHQPAVAAQRVECGIEFVDLDECSRDYIIGLIDATQPSAFIPMR